MVENGATNILPVKHSSYVLQRLNEQRKKGTFCDAILIVEGEKFPIHRSFLAANSDYFLSLFSSAEEQHNFVLAGVPIQGFRVILDFIYTSTFVLDLSNVHDVHKASSALHFTHVQTACEKVYHKIKQMKEQAINLNIERRLPPCNGAEFQPKRDQSGEANRLRTSPPTGLGALRPPAQYLRRIPSGHAFSDDSDSSLSKDSDVTPLSSTSSSNNVIENGSPEEVEQKTAMNLKRKIKKEIISTSFPLEPPSKRFAAPHPERQGSSEEIPEIKKYNPHQKKTGSLLSVYFEKADYSEAAKVIDGSETKRKTPYDSKHSLTLDQAVTSKKSTNYKKTSPTRERSRGLNRWPSDPQITSKASFEMNQKDVKHVEDGKKQDYLCSFKAEISAPVVSDLRKTTKQPSNEKTSDELFSKWKLKTNNEAASGCPSNENQVKVHRSRRKMLKTSKVCATTAD